MFEEQTKKQSGEANKAVKKQPDVKGEIDAQSDAMECDAESDKDDKPVKNVKPQTAGKSLKRSSNSIQSDSEDELEHKKENKKLISSGKNRKRVRVMADSSDEEFDHNTIESESKAKIGNVLTACLKTKVNEEPKQTTIVFEEESYVDAEGYTVTRAIKKEMKLTDATLQSSEKRDSTTTLSPKQETESSAVKSDSPDEPKKEIKKSAKSSLSAANKKGQTSILSFFKPKN